MKVDLVFIRKSKTGKKTITIKEVKNILVDAFDSVSDDDVTLSINGKTESCSYVAKTNSKNFVECSLTYGVKNTIANAKMLSTFRDKLIKGIHRKNVYIVLGYDESSESFCNSLYKKFNRFERELRKLIYLTVIKAFGDKWYDISFSEELKKDLKQRRSKGDVENALEELTYENMKDYLTDPISFAKVEDLLENELGLECIDELSKEELISYINSLRKVSIWKRFFGKMEKLSDFPELLSDIQFYRNVIMHSKNMSFDDYLKAKRLIGNGMRTIQNAIDEIENKMFTDEEKYEVGESLSVVFSRLSESSKQFATSLMPVLENMKSISALNNETYLRLNDNIAKAFVNSDIQRVLFNIREKTMSTVTAETLTNIKNILESQSLRYGQISNNLKNAISMIDIEELED